MKKLLTVLLILSAVTSFAAIDVGMTAPDFTLSDIRTGEKVTLSDFRGQVVVLQMWKNNWRECRAEIPHMIKLQDELLKELYPNLAEVQTKHGPLLKFLSVNAINPAKLALAEVEKYKIDFQVLEGRGSGVTSDYKVSKLPLLVVIDKNGIIRTSELYLQYEDLKTAVIPWLKDITDK